MKLSGSDILLGSLLGFSNPGDLVTQTNSDPMRGILANPVSNPLYPLGGSTGPLGPMMPLLQAAGKIFGNKPKSEEVAADTSPVTKALVNEKVLGALRDKKAPTIIGNSYSDSEPSILLTEGHLRGAKIQKSFLKDVKAVADQYKIDPFQLLAIAGKESTFGYGPYGGARRVDGTITNDGLFTYNDAHNSPAKSYLQFLHENKKDKRVKADKNFHGIDFYVVPSGKNAEDDNFIEMYNDDKLIDEYKKYLDTVPKAKDMNILEEVAKRIKNKGIESYNPGQKNYAEQVDQYKQLLLKNKTPIEFAKGGEVDVMPDGGPVDPVKPIYVTDKNDPRYKAYQDSLYMHNYGVNELAFLNDPKTTPKIWGDYVKQPLNYIKTESGNFSGEYSRGNEAEQAARRLGKYNYIRGPLGDKNKEAPYPTEYIGDEEGRKYYFNYLNKGAEDRFFQDGIFFDLIKGSTIGTAYQYAKPVQPVELIDRKTSFDVSFQKPVQPVKLIKQKKYKIGELENDLQPLDYIDPLSLPDIKPPSTKVFQNKGEYLMDFKGVPNVKVVFERKDGKVVPTFYQNADGERIPYGDKLTRQFQYNERNTGKLQEGGYAKPHIYPDGGPVDPVNPKPTLASTPNIWDKFKTGLQSMAPGPLGLLNTIANYRSLNPLNPISDMMSPMQIPGNMVQATYTPNVSVWDALHGKDVEKGFVEELLTDPLTFMGGSVALKIGKYTKFKEVESALNEIIKRGTSSENILNKSKEALTSEMETLKTAPKYMKLYSDLKKGNPIAAVESFFKKNKSIDEEILKDIVNNNYNLRKRIYNVADKNDVNILLSQDQLVGKEVEGVRGSFNKGIYDLGDYIVKKFNPNDGSIFESTIQQLGVKDKINSQRIKKTLQLKSFGNDHYAVIEKAKGVTLNEVDNLSSKLTSEQKLNFLKDLKETKNLNIGLDFHKGNFMYHPDTGIQLIDYVPGVSGSSGSLLSRPNLLELNSLTDNSYRRFYHQSGEIPAYARQNFDPFGTTVGHINSTPITSNIQKLKSTIFNQEGGYVSSYQSGGNVMNHLMEEDIEHAGLGGFFKKLGKGIVGGLGGGADSVLSFLGMPNVVQNSGFDKAVEQHPLLGKITGLSSSVLKTGLGIALPGIGTALSLGTGLINGLTPPRPPKQGAVSGFTGGSDSSVPNYNYSSLLQGLQPAFNNPMFNGNAGIGAGVNPLGNSGFNQGNIMQLLQSLSGGRGTPTFTGQPMNFAEGGEVQMTPIQTEKGEYLIHLDNSITKVNATKKHKQMDEDEITDVVPENTFVASADKKALIKKKDVEDIVMGVKTMPYEESKQGMVPEKILFSDLFKNNKMTPAELTKAVMDKYEVVDKSDEFTKNDVFTKLTNKENMEERGLWLQVIKILNEDKKNGTNSFKDGGNVNTYPNGGEVDKDGFLRIKGDPWKYKLNEDGSVTTIDTKRNLEFNLDENSKKKEAYNAILNLFGVQGSKTQPTKLDATPISPLSLSPVNGAPNSVSPNSTYGGDQWQNLGNILTQLGIGAPQSSTQSPAQLPIPNLPPNQNDIYHSDTPEEYQARRIRNYNEVQNNAKKVDPVDDIYRSDTKEEYQARLVKNQQDAQAFADKNKENDKIYTSYLNVLNKQYESLRSNNPAAYINSWSMRPSKISELYDEYKQTGKYDTRKPGELLTEAGYKAIDDFENTSGTDQGTSMEKGDGYSRSIEKDIKSYVDENIGMDIWDKMPPELQTQMYSFIFNNGPKYSRDIKTSKGSIVHKKGDTNYNSIKGLAQALYPNKIKNDTDRQKLSKEKARKMIKDYFTSNKYQLGGYVTKYPHGGAVKSGGIPHFGPGGWTDILGLIGSAAPLFANMFGKGNSNKTAENIALGSLPLSTLGLQQNINAQKGAYTTAINDFTGLGQNLNNFALGQTGANIAGRLSQDTNYGRFDSSTQDARLANFNTRTPSSFLDALTPKVDYGTLAQTLGTRGFNSAVGSLQGNQIEGRNAAGINMFNQDRSMAYNVLGQRNALDSFSQQFNLGQAEKQQAAQNSQKAGIFGDVSSLYGRLGDIQSQILPITTQFNLQKAGLEGQVNMGMAQNAQSVAALISMINQGKDGGNNNDIMAQLKKLLGGSTQSNLQGIVNNIGNQSATDNRAQFNNPSINPYLNQPQLQSLPQISPGYNDPRYILDQNGRPIIF